LEEEQEENGHADPHPVLDGKAPVTTGG
jgi:hypothetical protein